MEAPPVIADARPRFPRLLAGSLALLAVAFGTVLFFFDPSQYGFYPRCALHSMTGLECPGCGAQRAMYHLLHGHLGTALRYNAFLILSLPVFAVFLARFAARRVADGAMPAINFPSRWIKLIVGGLVLFGILRNIPVAPFTYLAPP